jgi:anti-sigma factor RsiW
MRGSRKKGRQTEHQYVEERLSAYLDGQLLPQERSIVEGHLATCESCRWDLTTLRQTVQWTRQLPTIPLPRAFTIPAPAQPRRASRRRSAFVPLLQGATAVVALLLVFVVAGDVMFTGLLPSSAPQPAAVREEAPAAIQATMVVEAMPEAEVAVEQVVVEKEATAADEIQEMGAELASAPAPAEPLPTEALPAEPSAQEGAAAATPATAGGAPPEEEAQTTMPPRAPAGEQPQPETPMLQSDLTQTLPLSSTPGVTLVITGRATVEGQPKLLAERTLAPGTATVEATAAAQVESTATPAPTPAPETAPVGSETAAGEAQPAPTEPVPAPSPEPTLAAAPTALARAEEPAQWVPPKDEQHPGRALQVPAAAWLRVAEAVLATTLVLLGVTTVVIMLMQRKPR